MTSTTELRHDAEPRTGSGPYRFTPAQWRELLEQPGFLEHAGNAYTLPRRLNGVPVLVIPEPPKLSTPISTG